jgi:hypothetical protein
VLEKFLALALVVAVSLVLLSMEERGLVRVLLVSGLVLAHHASFLRSIFLSRLIRR